MSAVTGPGRNISTAPSLTRAIVDSTPALVGPSSITSAIRPSRLASTCSAFVGLTRPLALALGAASGAPVRSEEHTSELQSLMRLSYAVFCLKKKKHKQHN